MEFSGPLLSQPNKVDELLEKHERQIRQAVRRSWFQRCEDYILNPTADYIENLRYNNVLIWDL